MNDINNKQLIDLDLNDIKSIALFSLNGIITDAKVIDVYDGDSVTVIFKYENAYHKWKCRLNGIDTPELRNVDQKEKAIKARDFLRSIILNKIVKLHCFNYDKYGRLLVEINSEVDGKLININKFLVEQNYAQNYDGGKKNNNF